MCLAREGSTLYKRKTKRITCDERSEVAALNTAEMRSLFSGGCAVLCEDFQTFFSPRVYTSHMFSERERLVRVVNY